MKNPHQHWEHDWMWFLLLTSKQTAEREKKNTSRHCVLFISYRSSHFDRSFPPTARHHLTSYRCVFAIGAEPTAVHMTHHSMYLWRRSENSPGPCTRSCRAERPRAASCCYCSCSQTFPGRPARALEKHIIVHFQCEIHCPLPIHKRM